MLIGNPPSNGRRKLKNPDIRGGELLRGERTTESLRQTVILVRSMLSLFSYCCELDEGRCTCLKNVDQCKNRMITIFIHF